MARPKNGNGKARGKPKANDTAKKPRVKKEKPTVEALTDVQRQHKHFEHVKAYENADAVKKRADKGLAQVKKLIEAEGGSVKAVKLAIELKSDKGEKTFNVRLAEMAEVCRWNGVGIQLDLFGKQKKSVAEHFREAGKRAALNDEARKPPDSLGQKDADVWMQGFDEGRTALNAERAQGFKSVGEVAADLIPPALVSPGNDASAPV